MRIEINVPALGESISEVVIGNILASTGSMVQLDAEILELETDKVNQVLYAPTNGKLTLLVQTGDTVKINQTIGYIEEQTEKNESVYSETKSPKDSEKMDRSLSKTIPPSSESEPLTSAALPPLDVNEKISLRYTKEVFLNDLDQPVSAEMTKPSALSNESPINAPVQSSQSDETRRPMTKIRRVIAKRLVEAQQTTAMLTTFNEVDLTAVIQLREKYKDMFNKKYGCKLGFMSFFIKATLSALQAFPDLNSFIEGDEIVQRHTYHIGVAVGTDKGVIVPVIRHVNQLSFAQIEQKIDLYAKLAREGKITLQDLQGGGFTITNGGTYGSLLSTPILIPPQCGILGMHKIEKRPVVIDDMICIRSMMYLALSYDHRLIDGKEAVSFLVHIKNQLEDPTRLLIDI